MKSLEIKITRDPDEVKKAQRLRFEVFGVEMGKGLKDSFGKRLDVDAFDGICDHLIAVQPETSEVIGTYRLLLSSEARRHSGFYSENEFDLRNILKLDGELLELGRLCVHRDYRDHGVIDSMWQAIAEYVTRRRVRYLFGCASLHTLDPAEVGAAYALLKTKYYADEEYRVSPLPDKAFKGLDETLPVKNGRKLFLKLPSLIKGYLKIGALVCGPPALDLEFGTTDFFMLLDLQKLSREYLKRLGLEVARI